MAIIASTLARIKSDPLYLLGGAQRINDCFARAGHVWRDRLLNPANTIALFVLQVLHGNTAISHLRHLSAVAVAACDSSYCAARARLSPSAVAAMVAEVCGIGSRCIEDAAAATVWLGRRVLLADGTGTLTPDAPALQEAWPQSSNQKPGCGFPAIKLLGLLDLASGAILHLTITCLRVQEFSQLGGLLGAAAGALRPRDVLLADRGFCSFAHLAMLAAASVDAVFRMHQRQVVDFTPGRPHRGKPTGGGDGGKRCRAGGVPSSRFVRRLGQEDQIVEWARPAGKRPAWMTEAQYAALPPTLLVRELRYRITVKGRRTRVVTIATTLLDPMRYPKREIAKLYGLRWEIEVCHPYCLHCHTFDEPFGQGLGWVRSAA
jgi:hypothetical protein